MQAFSLKLLLLHLFRSLHEKRCPQFFFYFFVSFVTVIYTPIRIHGYSCYIVLDTEMQAFSLKHPLLHLFRSLHGKRCPQFFWTFSFRYVSVYTPIRIHGYSCYILLDTEMQALSLKLPLLHLFLSLHEKKRCPQFYIDKCPEEFLVRSTLNFCYICYSVTGVTKCVCWKICVLFVKYLLKGHVL